SYSSADTEELVHRARAAHEPRSDGEKLGMMMGLATVINFMPSNV
ncbi:hypothetical protein A2U01_0081319, partial [Trifolium medium]|nr:hypothetical protein [Trifolium medium]